MLGHKHHANDDKLSIRRLGADRLPQMRIASESFENDGRIPERHSPTDGENLSPPLRFAEVPGGTRELVLIVEDPDATTPLPWVHWLMWGLPVSAAEIRGGVEGRTSLLGARQGKNSARTDTYYGPAPPHGHGEHHYHFQIFAVDTKIDLPAGSDRSDLLEAMEGHVLAAGDLVGTYAR